MGHTQRLIGFGNAVAGAAPPTFILFNTTGAGALPPALVGPSNLACAGCAPPSTFDVLVGG
jgi:hypothetical protein